MKRLHRLYAMGHTNMNVHYILEENNFDLCKMDGLLVNNL